MSRLSEILGVKEGQEFRYAETDSTYKVEGAFLYYKKDEEWNGLTGAGIYLMIENPDKIRPILRLTEQQITAIKGRIAEGTPWAARYKDSKFVEFYKSENCSPENSITGNVHNCDLYDFIILKNSPVYLPELLEESKDK